MSDREPLYLRDPLGGETVMAEIKPIDRRAFLRTLPLLAAVLAGCTSAGKKVINAAEHLAQATKDAEDALFSTIETYTKEFPQYQELEQIWSEKQLTDAWKSAVEEAQKNGGKATVELPNGEVYISTKTMLTVPEGTEITLVAHPSGTRLQASPEMSNQGKEYGKHDKNLLDIEVERGGRVILDGLYVNGGSKEGGKGPDSPWNAMIAIYGAGSGGREHFLNRDSVPAGEAVIRNCHFEEAEGPALMLQNLTSFKLAESTVRKTDSLITFNWCGEKSGKISVISNCYGQEILSDYILGVWSRQVEIEESGVALAWMHSNLRSCSDVRVKNCFAAYALAAFSTSEVIPGTNEQTTNISFENVNTIGSSCAYALQHAKGVNIVGGRHDRLGEVLTARNFLSRVRNPELVAKTPVYIGPNVSDVRSGDLHFRRSEKAPDSYQKTALLVGAEFYNFN